MNKRNRIYPLLLIFGAVCFIIGLIGLFVFIDPALASIINITSVPAPTQENHWARVYIAKPTISPTNASVFVHQLEDTLTSAPSYTPTPIATDPPTLTATEPPAISVEVTKTPGILSMEIVSDTPSRASVLPDAAATYPAQGNGERWIDVDLSEQRVYAYEGDVIVNTFVVSTGLPETPTVTGRFKIWIKVRVQDMSGPGYYLRDVPYVMFFYEDYALHGTYWHNNFGTPMSRGCVNLRVDDAAWLYGWTSVGTLVNVHD